MLTREQAQGELQRHLADQRKITHSRVVAHLMRRLAQGMGQDVELWEIVGLCHDFDDTATKSNRQLHGIMTAQWLADDLPGHALEAIRAHDHRTGITADTAIADALKLADALTIADEDAGREAVSKIGTEQGWQRLGELLARRPYLLPIIANLCERMNLDLRSLSDLIADAPRQDQPAEL